GELVGHDDDRLAGVVLQRVEGAAGRLPAQGNGVQNDCGNRELVVQLLRPLFPQTGRTDDQQSSAALGPVLADDQGGFDGLAQTHLICQQDAFLQGVSKREKGCLDLVRVQIDASVE